MEKLITVATYDFPTNAEAAKSLLESNGIRAFLADDNLVGMNWFVSNAVGGVKLQVAENDAERAAEILERAKCSDTSAKKSTAEGDIRFSCQECGKRISFPAARRGHVEDCPHCGEYVDVPDESEQPHEESGEYLAPQQNVLDEKMSDPGVISPRSKRQIWLEVLAVMCLAYIPNIFNAIAYLFDGSPAYQYQYSLRSELLDIVLALQIAVPLLVIIALSKDPLSMFGIVRPKWVLDIAITVFVLFCGMIVYDLFYHPTISLSSGYSTASSFISEPSSRGVFGGFVCLIACMANCSAQELVMRGYLLARLEKLLRSTTAAVLISTVLFASYHIYQGVPAMIASGAFGLFYAIVFCMTRRIWPLCVAHGLYNWMIFMSY